MSNLKTIRVLIAEDDYMVGKSTAAILRKMAYNVVGQALNGREAVEMTQSLRPDVVLMDIKMPIMDGIEATRHIYETCPTPVVALTAYVTPEVIEQAIVAGIGAYLNKPASVQEIERAINITIARFDDMVELRRLNTDLEAEIAERKRAEAALKESEERYRDLVEKAGLAILMDDKEGNFQYFNETFAEWFGYSLEEMRQKSIRELVHPDDLDRVMRFHTARIQGREAPSRYEVRGIRRNGSVIHLEVEAVEVKEGDNTIGTSSYLWDITERNQAEQALRESHERFLTVVDGIDADVYAADMNTYEILFMNEHIRDSFGHDLVGKICWDVFRGESGPCGHCTNDRLVDAAGHPTGVYVWEGQNPLTGNWYMNCDRAIKWMDGRLVRLQIATDITQRKHAEDELLRRTEDLILINDVNSALNRGASLDEVIQLFSDKTQGMYSASGVGGASVFLLSEDKQHLVQQNLPLRQDSVQKLERIIGRALPQFSIPLEAGSMHLETMQAGKPQVLNDPPAIHRWMGEFLGGPWASSSGLRGQIRKLIPQIRKLLGIESMVIIPLYSANEPVGLMEMSSGASFAESDVRRLELASSQLITTIERRRAEAALQESEERYRTLFEQANDAILLTREDDTIVDVNPRMCAMMGYGREELLTMHVPDLQAPEVRGQAGSVVKNEVALYGNAVFETLNLHRDGTRIPIEVSISKVTGVEGESFISVVRDITERKQAEEEIQQRNRELAALNALTAAILQSALDLDEVLQRTADGIVEGLGCNTAFILLLDEKEGVFKGSAVSTRANILTKMNALIGFPLLQIKIPARRDFNEAMNNLWDGRATIRHDLYELVGPLLSKTVCSAMQRLIDSRTFFTMPLLAKGKTMGGIVASTPEELSQEDTAKLITFANQAAIAIENAQLYRESQQRALEQETLREAALALTTALNRNRVIERILAQLQRVVPYDSASVQLLRGDHMELVGGRGFPNLSDLLGTSFPADGDNPNSEVVRTRAPFIVDDAPTMYEGFRSGPHVQTTIRSWLGVPMLIGEQLVGMIALDKREPGFYTQERARLAEAFAAQAAIAIENARLFEETQKRVAELEALQRTSLQLTSSLDLTDVLGSIAENALSLVGATNCHLYLYDETSETFTFGTALWQDGRQEAAVKTPRRDGLTATVVQKGQAVIINDAPRHPFYTNPEVQKWGLQAIASFPLKRAERVVGVFSIAFLTPHTFSQEELRVLGLLADQAAIAIENARLFTEAEQRATELSTMLEAARAVSSTLDLEQVLALIAEQMAKAIGTTGCTLSRWDRKADAVVTLTQWRQRWTEWADEPGASYALNDYPATRAVLEKRQPITIQATDPDADPAELALMQQAGAASVLILPLIVGEQVIGLVELDETEREREFTDAEIRLCQALANQVAVAIENARLFEGETRRAAQLALINEVGEKAASILDSARLMQETTRSIQESFNHYNVALSLLNEDRRELVMQAIAGGFEHIVPGGYRQSIDQGIVGLVARTGKSWSANDVSRDPYYIRGFSEKTLTKSELCVPIKLGDKVIGVLDLGSVHLNDFDQADITAMEAVADRVAIGLENARLYEQAQRHSERLAQTLSVSELLHRDLALEQLLEQIAHGTVRLGFRRAVINVCQPGQEDLVQVRAMAGLEGSDREALTGATYHWSDFQTLMQQQFQISRSYLIRHGEVDWGRDFRGLIITSARENHGPGYWHAEDMLLVPMWGSRGKPVGLLSVDEPLDGLLPDINTIQTLEAFANQAAIAIENARLFEETRQRALQLQAVAEVGRRVSAILDPDELFSSVAKTIQQRFGYYHVDILLVEADTGYAVFKASSDSSAEESWKKQGLRFKIGKEGLIGWAAHTGEPFLANDVSQEPRYLPDELLPEVESELIVPLKMGERVVGVLDVSSNQLNAFDQDDLFVLQTLANQIAIAIENARLFEDTRRHHEEMAALNEIAMTVTRTLKLREILETIQEKVLRLLNEKYVPAFALFNEEDQTFTLLSTNLQTPALRRTEKLIGMKFDEFSSPLSQLKPALLEALLAGKHYVTDDGSDILGPLVGNMLIKRAQRVMGVRRIVNLPLWTEGKLVGSMILFSQRDNIADEEIQLLSAISNQAAIAIKKIHLFEQLEERRVYLEGVLGAAPDAIVTLDAHQRIAEWNPGAERLFGYSRGEAIGQNLDRLVTNPDVFEEAVGFTQTVMGMGEIPPTESVRYRKDGSPVDVILAGSPILVGDELIGTVAAYTDITARKRMEETLRALALVDDLTNLYNRRGFVTLGQQQLKAANRAKRRMVLLFADFDGLKRINDAFGHPEGDLALIEVANVLRDTFRESDIIARIGGDEFVVLAIETDGIPAEFLTARLQRNLEAHNANEGRRYKLSLSVGLARYNPESPCAIDELLAQADRAMYEKKHDDTLPKEAT